jgi:transposase-like protein
MRWPEGVRCPQCDGDNISRFQAKGKTGKARHLYQCLDKTCRYQFSPTTGTIFHDSHLPLNKWFSAIALLCDSKRDMTVNQLRVELGVQYKTAAHVTSRVRQAIRQGSIELVPKLAVAAAQAPIRRFPLSGPPLPAHHHPALADRRSVTANFLSQVAPTVSATTIDNMLRMFVSITQMSVQPPLVFVKYIRDKVFT